MNPGFLGTLLASAGAGYDYQSGLDRQTQIYQDQRRRQQTADEHAQTLFDEGQEKYQHDHDRRAVLETLADTRAIEENKGMGLRNALEQNTVDRLPVTNQHQDDAFTTEQQLRKAQIGNVGQEQSLRALQIKQQQLGVDDATLAHHVAQNQRALVQAYQSSAQSGDFTQFVRAYNDTIGHTIGHNITGLKQNKDGSFTATQEGGQPLQFKDAPDMLSGALSMNDPNLMIDSLHAQRQAVATAAQERAKDPKKFGELVRDDNGVLGNVDLTTNRFVPLTDSEGNALRGTLAGKTRAGVANDAAEAFYQQRLKANDTPDEALEATSRYMKVFHPSARGIWNQPSPQEPQISWPGEGDPSPPPRYPAPAGRASAVGQQIAPGALSVPPVKGAKRAQDGNWYVPDPQRPGKWLMVSN